MATAAIDALIHAPWWPELLAVKDSLSWTALAERYHTNVQTLRRALQSVGATKARLPTGRRAAAPAGPGRRGPRSPIDAHAQLVGKMSDGEVGRRAGVSAAAVKQYRLRRGIPAWRPEAGAGTVARRASRLDPFAGIVGVMPDRAVAARAGVTPESVRLYRKARGIPSPARTGAGAEPERLAFELRITDGDADERYVVVAVDLAGACARAAMLVASRGEGWRLSAVREVAPFFG